MFLHYNDFFLVHGADSHRDPATNFRKESCHKMFDDDINSNTIYLFTVPVTY
jgi:hypothetical protein